MVMHDGSQILALLPYGFQVSKFEPVHDLHVQEPSIHVWLVSTICIQASYTCNYDYSHMGSDTWHFCQDQGCQYSLYIIDDRVHDDKQNPLFVIRIGKC